MDEKKIGRQTPTTAVVLPYTNSLGTEAVRIYNKSGRTAQQWQELLLEDIMALNEENQWVILCHSGQKNRSVLQGAAVKV